MIREARELHFIDGHTEFRRVFDTPKIEVTTISILNHELRFVRNLAPGSLTELLHQQRHLLSPVKARIRPLREILSNTHAVADPTLQSIIL
jgi:hypothetical protein